MEARLAAVGHEASGVEIVLPAQAAPVVLLLAGQHEHYLEPLRPGAEPPDGVHQYGQAAHGDELLGQPAAHAQALASGHDYGVVGRCEVVFRLCVHIVRNVWAVRRARRLALCKDSFFRALRRTAAFILN